MTWNAVSRLSSRSRRNASAGSLREVRVLALDADLREPGVVDEHVERPVRRLGGGDQLARLAGVGEVGDVRLHGRPGRAQLGCARCDAVGRGGDRHPGPESRQQLGTGEADARLAAAAGHESGAVVQPERARRRHGPR